MSSNQEPGLFLGSESLAGPLPAGGYLMRRKVLEKVSADGCLAPEWFPVLRRMQEEAADLAIDLCRRQADLQQCELACSTLQWSLDLLKALPAEQQQPLIQELADRSSQLLAGFHRLLLEENVTEAPSDQRPWLALASRWAGWHRCCGLSCPDWFMPVKEQLVRAAALAWLEYARAKPADGAAGQAIGLLEQLAGLHDPCPEWILLARKGLEADATVLTSPIRQRLFRLELRPEQTELIPEGETLVVNVAKRLEAAAHDHLGVFFQELLESAQPAQSGSLPRMKEPESSLHCSLQSLRSRGQRVPASWFRGLAIAADHWRRAGGEAVDPWPDFPVTPLQEGCLLVRPGNVELAALRSALEQPDQQQQALELIASRNHDQAWMEALRDDWWCDPGDVTENLRRDLLNGRVHPS
jgi:hypothetical protein